ncbi:MAG: FtsX-like permease family protein [Thermoplasmata archaeon]
MAEITLANVSFILAVAAILLVFVAALRKRLLLRLALRNLIRRKTQVALAIAGLTVATSIISGALVIDASFDATVTAIVLRGTDLVDELIEEEDEAGNPSFFNETVYDDLEAELPSMEHVDGLAPRILLPASVKANRTGLVDPSLNLIGFDPAVDLGVFLLEDGTELDGSALAIGEVYVNQELASAIEVERGDELEVFVNGLVLYATIRDVVQDRGRGGWQTVANVFLPLSTLQTDLGVGARINQITVSNVGGVEDGHLVTDEAVAELDAGLGAGHPFTIVPIKRDQIELFTSLLEQLTQLFVLMSAFTIIAGILLIMNIFSGLAEERKTEMGMSRALGMRRSHLVQTFIFEGAIYAMASAALGAIAGLGVATLIMEAFRQIFTFFARDLVIAFSLPDLLTAFSLGLLLTLITVAVASWRIGKLNIIRAMRDLPEPPASGASWAEMTLAAALVAGGAFALYYSLQEVDQIAYAAGGPLIAFGLALGTVRRFGMRVPLTAAGIFTLAWGLSPWRLVEEADPNIGAFVVIGVLLVTGGVLTVIANSEVLLKLGTKLTRKKRNVPVVRAAIAYPMAKKFRTGVILAMFSLIMFTITVMSMVMGITGSTVDVLARQESGGYDLVGFSSPFAPIADLDQRLGDSGLAPAVAVHDDLLRSQVELTPPGGQAESYPLIGVSQGFANRNEFTFFRMADRYETAADVWQALRTDASLAVVDRGVQPQDFGPTADLRLDVGDRVTLANALGEEVAVTIIGIMDAGFVSGVFLQEAEVERLTNALGPTLFYVQAAAGESPTDLAKAMQSELVDHAFVGIVIRDLVEESLEVTLNVMQLIQAFLALGLAVGISGLGVLAVRNVIERRATIGTLRALGFRKNMILKAFLLELSFVAVLGIVLGLVLGIALTYNLYLTLSFFGEAEFVIPWPNLILILGLAFLASLLATLSPSRRASKLPPAEALRQAL